MSLTIVRRSSPLPWPVLDPQMHPVLQRVYSARGVRSAQDLDLSMHQLLPIGTLGGVEAAAELLCQHRERGDLVLIIGDFDADGATSTAVFVRALRSWGFAAVDFLVPNRFEFGYGLTPEIVALAATQRPALIVTVDAVAILEFFRRLKPPDLRKAAGSVLLPALYLFFGFLLVFAYNDIILSVRFFGATDATLFMMDQWLLHGFSVSSLCHWAVHSLPVSFFRVLELIYFGMFSQIGAALILTGLYDNKRRAFQFVGTILTAYYLALALFYLWPSQGPFYLCPTHFSVFPDQLQTYAFQKWSVANSQALWKHVRVRHISTDYYIALPCMHIAQPLVVAWFLRRWKRMLAVLAAYDVLLLAAIVLLEWHYVVDIIAGVLVACVAIAVVDGGELWSWIRSRPATVWVGKNGLSLE